MNDSQYPWFILVPRVDVREIFQLTVDQRKQLLDESCFLAEHIDSLFSPDKLNIATIGNLVPQLHMHHVARFQGDKAWPAPIWGKHPPLPYEPSRAQQIIDQMRQASADWLIDA